MMSISGQINQNTGRTSGTLFYELDSLLSIYTRYIYLSTYSLLSNNYLYLYLYLYCYCNVITAVIASVITHVKGTERHQSASILAKEAGMATARKSGKLTPEVEWEMANKAILAVVDKKYRIDKELDKIDEQKKALESKAKALMDERQTFCKKESSLVAKRQREAIMLGIEI